VSLFALLVHLRSVDMNKRVCRTSAEYAAYTAPYAAPQLIRYYGRLVKAIPDVIGIDI